MTCHDRGIDAKVFIWAMFAIHGFKRSPGYKALASDWAVNRFLRDEGKFLTEWGQENMTVAPPVDANLDLTPFGEGLKLALDPDHCITAIGEHGGYHPLSKRCQGCPMALLCSKKVQELMGVDMAKMRALPKQEAISLLTAMFDNYPRTPLTAGGTSA